MYSKQALIHKQPKSTTLKDFPPIIYETPDGHFVLLIGWLWLITTTLYWSECEWHAILFNCSLFAPHTLKSIAKWIYAVEFFSESIYLEKMAKYIFELTVKYIEICVRRQTLTHAHISWWFLVCPVYFVSSIFGSHMVHRIKWRMKLKNETTE